METTRPVSQLFHNNLVAMGYNPPKIVMNPYVRSDGTSALYLQVIIAREKACIPIGVFVTKEEFDKSSGRIIQSSKRRELNLVIDAEMSKAVEIFIEFTLLRKPYDLNAFMKKFQNWEIRQDFIKYFDKNLKARKDSISENTYRRYVAIYNKLKSFREKIPFYDLTPELITGFDNYMKSNNNNTTTRHINHVAIRYFINTAITNDKISIDDPYLIFEKPKPKKRIICLTDFELRKIISYYESNECKPSHKGILNIFLLMCFTSMRISDALVVTLDNIISDHLVFSPIKTRNTTDGDNTVRIPITSEVAKYIKPYKNNLVKPYAEQYINKILDDIGGQLEINKKITTHVARHTFGTMYIERGGDVASLQGIMGHSKIEQTMEYVHISNEFKKQQMTKVFSDFTQ